MTEECGRNCTLIGIVPTFGWNRRSLLLDLWRDSRCPCRCSMSEPLPWAKGYWRRRLWLVCFDPSIEYLILRLRLNKAWGRIILIRIVWRPKIHPTITCVPRIFEWWCSYLECYFNSYKVDHNFQLLHGLRSICRCRLQLHSRDYRVLPSNCQALSSKA